MIVVADASPLNYPVLIAEIELLPALYDGVLIPAEGHRELQRPRTPPSATKWADHLPSWCEARVVASPNGPGVVRTRSGRARRLEMGNGYRPRGVNRNAV